MKTPVILPIVAALFCASISVAQDSEKPRPEPRDKLEMVKRKIQELHEAGKHDEAAQFEKRVREEMGKPGEGSGGEQPERMRHIAEAIKHLRAAGLNEPAEHIEKMVREQQQQQQQKVEGRDRPEAREGGEQMQRALREMQEQMQRALRDTHEQMAKMAHAIDELREQVGKRKE